MDFPAVMALMFGGAGVAIFSVIIRGILYSREMNREEKSVGQRILPYRTVPVLPKPDPPRPPRSGGVPAPKEPEKPACAHVFRHPVYDVWGTEIAGICIGCTAQVTNEEWVRVGW